MSAAVTTMASIERISELETDLIPLRIDEPFRFGCSPEVPCFNECCRDLNQFLTPYDILRLTRRLGIGSGEFLARYTIETVGPETGLPVVSLRMLSGEEGLCPFVTDNGCSVYEDRPSSCRIYPLARAISRSRETGEVTEHFALVREAHCRGFEQLRSQNVKEWIKDQEAAIYNAFNDRLMEIIRLKNQMLPGPLDLRGRQSFRLGLYDLDAFRRHIQEKGVPRSMECDPPGQGPLIEDDLELLTFGHDWVRFELFGI